MMFFNARQDLATKRIGGDLILYDLNNKVLHVLNMTAAKVFHMCDGAHTPEEMAHELVESFDGIEPVQACEDVKQTLDVLKAKKLVAQTD